MAEERIQRRLAAILVADVVGFSRLMGHNEERTLAVLKSLRAELFDPVTSQYGGRVFKNTGDGALVEFPSAVDAVQAAVDVQRALSVRNADLPPERQIELRIGISLGDVIVDGDDLYGNGVNVAARMEGLSEPGGICVSGNVYEHMLAATELDFEDLGEQEVKNIDRPIRAYRVGGDLGGSGFSPAPKFDPTMRRTAIAVLPFDNLTHDPEQEYFSDGLTEDIITALSLWRTFPVIARNSTFSYKGQSPDIRKVGEELGARYILEGSVRKAGDRVRISVQLIDADTGHHLWAERYDRRIDDIFALQDEITERVATTVEPELERVERQRFGSQKPSDLQAWDYYLRGMALLQRFSGEENSQAREMFEHAVELDPAYARGHAGIAYSHYRDVILAHSDDNEASIRQCVEAAQLAVSLDDTDGFAHFVLSRGLDVAGKTEQGLHEAKLAIELNPNDGMSYASLGFLLISAGQPDEGIAALHRAHQLSPKDPRLYLLLGMESGGHFVAGRFDEAAAIAKDALNRRPGEPSVRALLIASLCYAGREEEARSFLAEGEPIDLANLDHLWLFPWFDSNTHEKLASGLRKAGWEG